MKTHYSFLLLFAIGLTGCAVNGTLPSGRYLETRGPRVSLFSSKELRLFPNCQFEYTQWTDMVGVGPQGRGKYTLRGQQLHLVFNGQSLEQLPSIQTHLLLTQPDSDSVTVSVDLRVEKEAADGLTVLAFDETGRTLTAASSNQAGQAHLRLARTQRPHHFTITGIGFQSVKQPWPLNSSEYNVQLAAKLGPAHKAGETISFRVLQQSAAKLVLRQGADTITLAATSRP
ncbi:hypothetical protein [Hymenobacter actinosclerus]|uniref:Uncharacterized protein n=1 Tax=Hymenobacter actinosclerus TaxID=82805 RepID=A0A1I0DUA4_9BACT|nr:hypothetical protein [Hymenobacter actinosclerus]SET35542.1 hypothetical protein SAMN04487998_1544 [Hymenobacter actinosclerus]